jgi:hypothetical protein
MGRGETVLGSKGMAFGKSGRKPRRKCTDRSETPYKRLLITRATATPTIGAMKARLTEPRYAIRAIRPPTTPPAQLRHHGDRLSGGSEGLALLANTIATGAALAALILTFGPISDAHFNPVVTIADAPAGRAAPRDGQGSRVGPAHA